jgi:L-alanine-DL-glutamate epimerase-like enolase superfamily enzyme
MDESIVKAAREVIGPDCRLMVDAGASDGFWPNGLQWACRTAEMLASYDVAWFEEPLHPDALQDYVELRPRSRVPIAGGEVLTRRQAFQPWIQAGAFDIVQPDVTKVGGISEERRIAWMARDHGVKMIPHGWNTAVGLAADLQLASAFPDTDLVEYLNGSPFIDGIVAEPWRLDNEGLLPIGTRPGLGLQLDPEAVGKYTRQERLWTD